MQKGSELHGMPESHAAGTAVRRQLLSCLDSAQVLYVLISTRMKKPEAREGILLKLRWCFMVAGLIVCVYICSKSKSRCSTGKSWAVITVSNT